MGLQLALHGLRALWGDTLLPLSSRCSFRSLHVRTAAADGPHLIRRVAVVAKAKLPCFARKYVVQNEWEFRGRHHSRKQLNVYSGPKQRQSMLLALPPCPIIRESEGAPRNIRLHSCVEDYTLSGQLLGLQQLSNCNSSCATQHIDHITPTALTDRLYP